MPNGFKKWEDIMANGNLPVAERVEAFKQLQAEKRSAALSKSGEPSSFTPRASICRTVEDAEAAKVLGPKVFFALVEEQRRLRAGASFDQAPLTAFALAYNTVPRTDGKLSDGPFAYIVKQVARPYERGLIDEVDFSRTQRNGGSFAERLAQLAQRYQATYGCLSFLAEPKLVKKDGAK